MEQKATKAAIDPDGTGSSGSAETNVAAETQKVSELPSPRSLRYRLASLVLVCVLPVWIIAGCLVYNNYRSKRASTEQRMLEAARALSLYVDRELSSMQGTLNTLATTRELASGDLSGFHARARIVLSRYPGADIVLADSTGQLLMNTYVPFGTSLPKRANQESVRRIFETRQIITSDLFRAVVSGEYRVSIDVPVLRDGRVVYDLGMSIPAHYFSGILSQQRLAPEWLGAILDRNQVVIARSRMEKEFIGQPASPPVAKTIREVAEGTVETINLEGVPQITAFSRSDVSGWAVGIGVPKAILFQDAWNWLKWTVAVVGLLSLAGVAIALRMARSIAASVRSLIAPALALGRGEPISVSTLDLKETNEVGESLMKASRLVQQRVEERARAEAARLESEELKRLNTNLADTSRRLEAVLDTALVGITITGRRGALLDVNPEYCRIVGYAKDELIGKNFIDFTHPDDHDNNLRMRQLLDSGELQSYELEKRYVRKDGKVVWARAKTSALNSQLRVSAIEDITERKLAEEERNTTVAFLALVTKQFDTHGLVRAAAEFFQQESGCQAVGIRMREGDDYPYYEARGFPAEFIRLENSLCERDFAGRVVRDCAGNPALECMCDNVICGRFDPSKPFFTSAGTFWSNSTTELLASTSEADRQARTRNRCNGEGYESVALIPLHVGEQRLGLLQLNDRRPNRFSQEFISLWERLAGHLSVALAKFEAEEAQRRLAAIVETSSDAIFSKSLDGTILTWNAGAEKILGYTAKEIIGKSIYVLLPSERREEEDAILDGLGRGKSLKHFETVRVAKDGRHVDVSLTISPLRDAGGKLIGASKILRDITEKKRAESALQDARAHLSAVFESTEEMIWSVDRNYTLVTFNGALQRFCAAHHGLAITPGMTPTQLGLSPQRAQWWAQAYERCLNEGPYRIEYNAEGGDRILELGLHPIRQHGVVSEVSVFAKDITERKRTEAETEELRAQLSQAQKMESIGRLAGGVAHDFNNLLMVIASYTEMLSADLPAHSPQRKKMEQIIKAVERATSLTRQMLAFSRKQVLAPVVLDLNAVVNDTTKLLRRLIGEDVELQLVLGASLWSTRADPDQLVQVLMNLCVNARDAMPHGGTLRIETSNVTVTDGREQENPPIPLGEYVKLAVSDTGVGIKEELLGQIFEPFFTTKEPGKGTGLGLSTVYGTVTQSGGQIRVSSELGRGSCFAIYMQRTAEAVSPEDVTPEQKPIGGTETILVAEDEEGLRDALCGYLCDLGYNVISADSGQQAVMAASGREIDLLITDVVMPKMSGRKLSEILSSAHTGMKTLFMSGYTDDAVLRHGVEESRVSFLQKPFSFNVLARRVRDLLDGPL